VDEAAILCRMLELFHELARELPLLFLVHPRTRVAAERAGLTRLLKDDGSGLRCIGPQPYLDTISLIASAAVVFTDSGGLQEETAVLGVPCLTLRENTERPVTVELGTSRLVGNGADRIREAFEDVRRGAWPTGQPIPLWDGQAAVRVAGALADWLHARAGPRPSPQP
jgi:UDP-N-acetylglucosamine 2-epimerase (non-hydrolysing)